jgi:hypothetical protein
MRSTWGLGFNMGRIIHRRARQAVAVGTVEVAENGLNDALFVASTYGTE